MVRFSVGGGRGGYGVEERVPEGPPGIKFNYYLLNAIAIPSS